MEAIVNNLIKALGWSIFHSLWQGAIIYGVLMLTAAAIPKLNAKVKHNLAYAAMCLMFTGFCITFFSIFQFAQNAAAAGQTAGTAMTGAEPQSFLLGLPQEINSRTEHLFPYLVSVYSIGILMQLLILSFGYQKLLQLKNAERIAVPAKWQALFQQLSKKLGLRKKISFYLSANVNVPLVIGYFKPIVLFPLALSSQLDMQQVEAILIHELSHIRRNDYLLNLIKTAMETVLFFNPFIWLSGRFINIEREHACDDLVLKFTGTPVTYAHALLKLEILKDKAAPALSMAATGGNQHLYQRIKRITDMKTNYMNAKQQLFAITLTVATVISLAWVNPSKTQAEKKEKTFRIVTKTKTSIREARFAPLDQAETLAAAAICTKLCDEDTTKKKKRFKIVTVDAKGEKKEYDSIKEMPDSLRQEVISETFLNKDDFKFDFRLDSSINASMTYIKSPEFKKVIKDAQNQAHIMVMKFNSPEWKKQQADIQKHAMTMSMKFKNEDFKKLQKDVKKMSEEMKKKFNSPEWKKQQEDFKKHIENTKKLHESAEYKELREKFEKEVEKLKEQKGLKNEISEDIRIENPN